MEMLFLYLYPLVGVISLLAFIPQIKTLLKASSSPINVSVKSWLLWTFGSVISFGYGVYVLQDLMFCIIAGTGMFLNHVVVLLVLYRRYITFGPCHDLEDLAVEYFCRAPYLGICQSRFRS